MMKNKSSLFIFLLVSLFSFFHFGCLNPESNIQNFSENESSGIQGQSSLPNALILAKAENQGQDKLFQTNSSGQFRVDLKPGIYQLVLQDDRFELRDNVLEKNLIVSEGFLTTVLNVRLVTTPIVSNVLISTQERGFTVTFDTDILANSYLEYGKDVSYGFSTPIDPNAKTNHLISLNDLEPGETYHFRIIARRRNLSQAQFTSEDYTVAIPN